MSFTKEILQNEDFDASLDLLKKRLDILETSNTEAISSKVYLLQQCETLNTKIQYEYDTALNLYSHLPDFPKFGPSNQLKRLRDKRRTFKEYLRLYRQENDDHYKREHPKYILAMEQFYKRSHEHERTERQKRNSRSLELENQRKRIVTYFSQRRYDSSKTRRVYWKLLPRGKWSFNDVKGFFHSIQKKRPEYEYDVKGLDKIEALQPSDCYIGNDEFEGYVVFCFPNTEVAVLENPLYGNATYIIGKNWDELSRLSKLELLTEHHDIVKKVVHRGDWYSQLVLKLAEHAPSNVAITDQMLKTVLAWAERRSAYRTRSDAHTGPRPKPPFDNSGGT